MSDPTPLRRVTLDGRDLADDDSFHDAFARAFSFFEGHGRNMDAWIDCMSSLDDELTGFALQEDELVLLELEHFDSIPPELLAIFLDALAFVNQRYDRPRIALLPVHAGFDSED